MSKKEEKKECEKFHFNNYKKKIKNSMYILCKEYIFYRRYSIYNKMQSTITGILWSEKKTLQKKTVDMQFLMMMKTWKLATLL